MKLCQINTVIIFQIKVGYVDILTRIGYFRRGCFLFVFVKASVSFMLCEKIEYLYLLGRW